MSQEIIQVDSFTDEPFKGNPAGVCLMDGPADDTWMQDVAAEMNLSETAFLYPKGDGYHLRWFTPTVEVEQCGHATLATAHVLWEDSHLEPDRQARFHTISGLLTADKRGDIIEVNFPARPIAPCELPDGLLEAMGVEAQFVGRNEFEYLLELASEETVRACAPDFAKLTQLGIRSVIITARRAGKFDFVSRFFGPGLGINEDPVTGAAHCALGPYWSKKLNKTELIAYQASRRGGVVHVRVQGDRVVLGGQAVTVMRCRLL